MVRAQVLESEPAQAVAWQGRAWGITTHQRYTFSDQGRYTLVGFRETLGGREPCWAYTCRVTLRPGPALVATVQCRGNLR